MNKQKVSRHNKSIHSSSSTDKLSFWQTWSPDLAYILGFAYADGSVRDGNRNSLILVQKDVEILEKINARIPGGGDFFATGRNGIGLRITIRGLPGILKPYGLIPRKTYVGYWPVVNIPTDLMSHYIRGFFDGDGYVIQKTSDKPHYRKQWIFGFACHLKEYLSRLVYELTSLGLSEATIYPDKKSWKVKYHARDDIRKFHELIYHNASIYIQRKRDVFNEAIAYFTENPPCIGETSPSAKLTESEVREIRNLYTDGGYSYVKLAQMFGVGKTTVENIIKRRKWKHV